jgi:hypothetical protein
VGGRKLANKFFLGYLVDSASGLLTANECGEENENIE